MILNPLRLGIIPTGLLDWKDGVVSPYITPSTNSLTSFVTVGRPKLKSKRSIQSFNRNSFETKNFRRMTTSGVFRAALIGAPSERQGGQDPHDPLSWPELHSCAIVQAEIRLGTREPCIVTQRGNAYSHHLRRGWETCPPVVHMGQLAAWSSFSHACWNLGAGDVTRRSGGNSLVARVLSVHFNSSLEVTAWFDYETFPLSLAKQASYWARTSGAVSVPRKGLRANRSLSRTPFKSHRVASITK